MNVLFTSTTYPADPKDWRGTFIGNLVSRLADREGIRLSLWSPPGYFPDKVTYAPYPRESAWLKELMDAGGIAQIIRTRTFMSTGVILKLLHLLRKVYSRSSDADVIHVNWLQNALPLWGIKKPAVISVLGSDFGLLRMPGMIRLLRLVFAQRRCILAPNAEWMVPELEKRFGDVAHIRCIPFGVDSGWFSINRKHVADMPRKWLVISRVTRDKIGELFTWGDGLFGGEDELHLFGPQVDNLAMPGWVHYHGPAAPLDLVEQWFPDAAGLISLSRHDEGRPQVIIEAMAANLPVLASDLPAHRNVIAHKKTGWLAPSKDSFCAGLKWLSEPGNNRKVGLAAREWARRDIGMWDECADRFKSAYEWVVAGDPV